ncbi:type I-E CRISPR-associated protein Cas6/Cse3/CasE [Streptomyces avermitilis]|uniref:type I-E CRISPR-associated protein Cas6/Cse3/CasE n=1 Tax=Streptomyces avermitilis TaxID=33903 RepID=UPI0033B3B492
MSDRRDGSDNSHRHPRPDPHADRPHPRAAGALPHHRRPRGKITSLQGPGAQAWWQRQTTTAGLHLTGPTETLRRPFLSPERPAPFCKFTQFDGTATITDPDLLATALSEGIGKGKAYGAGLLTLAPA